MSDVLALLAELERADNKTKPVDVKSNTKRNASAGSNSQRIPNTRSSRPSSLPPPLRDQTLRPRISPSRPESSYSERPASSYTPSLRKISFADAPRPSLRRLKIPTRTSALPSGFPYDSRLFKYGVTAEEWNRFSSEIVKAAEVPLHTHVPVLSWTWTFYKSKVTKGVKQQMLYESSDLMREMKRWNRIFKRQGFQVSLKLPNTDDNERGGQRDLVEDTKEENDRAKLESRRFTMVITQNAEKKAASIYSRSSSLTRTVTGEGAAATKRIVSLLATEPEHDIDDEKDHVDRPSHEPELDSESHVPKGGLTVPPPPGAESSQVVASVDDGSHGPSLERQPDSESGVQRHDLKAAPPRPDFKQDMFDGQYDTSSPSHEAGSNSEPILQRESSMVPSPGSDPKSVIDTKIDPFEPEAKSEPSAERDSPLPDETKPLEVIEHEGDLSHIEAKLKDIVVDERPVSKGDSKTHSKEVKPQLKSLNDFLTTAGGFDDWNNMDDD